MKKKGKNDDHEKKMKIFENLEQLMYIIATLLTFTGLTMAFEKISRDENPFMKLFFLCSLIFVVICVGVFLLIYLKKAIRRNSEEKYDFVREKLERQLIDIQTKLSETEDQWKASYHLVLASQLKNSGDNDRAIKNLKFLENFGLKDEDFNVDPRLVFYLSSFSSQYELTYKICKTVCSDLSLNLIRGDEILDTGDIFSQIIRQIVRASLIIVNIDGKNPNVFYELGIAHSLGKRVILISKRNAERPFDVRQYRTLLYGENEELKEVLPDVIKKYIGYDQNCVIHLNSDSCEQRQSNEIMISKGLQNTVLNLEISYDMEKMENNLLRFYLKYLENNPDNIQVLLMCGRLYKERREFEKALEYFIKVIEIDKENKTALAEIEKLSSELNGKKDKNVHAFFN